ncbi:hypothetical protein [Streptomyces sp. NPDC050560]|uniref:hypothetical protein n=1 Tax=Streptomyces sp. NPDC050560 TaxID=3365630 RepID=UPI00379F3CDB
MSARTHRQRRRGRSAAAALALAALTACGDPEPSGLSASGLHDTARGAAEETKECPVGYDLGKAASAARVPGRAEQVRARAELADKADEDAPIRTFEATDLECDYRLGGEPMAVQTVAAGHGDAVGLMGPLITRNAGLDVAGLRTYLAATKKAAHGTPVLTPGGNVASVRLDAAEGDSVALVITYGSDDEGTELTAAQVKSLSKELAAQADW